MPATAEIRKRIGDLEHELDSVISVSHRRDLGNHWTAFVLMLIALSSSAVAGFGGISGMLQDPHLIGSLAAVPAAIALFGTTMKFQEKSNWHYRRKNGVKAFKFRLRFELPESPNANNVAAISLAFREFEGVMQQEWEKQLAFNWSTLSKKRDH